MQEFMQPTTFFLPKSKDEFTGRKKQVANIQLTTYNNNYFNETPKCAPSVARRDG